MELTNAKAALCGDDQRVLNAACASARIPFYLLLSEDDERAAVVQRAVARYACAETELALATQCDFESGWQVGYNEAREALGACANLARVPPGLIPALEAARDDVVRIGEPGGDLPPGLGRVRDAFCAIFAQPEATVPWHTGAGPGIYPGTTAQEQSAQHGGFIDKFSAAIVGFAESIFRPQPAAGLPEQESTGVKEMYRQARLWDARYAFDRALPAAKVLRATRHARQISAQCAALGYDPRGLVGMMRAAASAQAHCAPESADTQPGAPGRIIQRVDDGCICVAEDAAEFVLAAADFLTILAQSQLHTCIALGAQLERAFESVCNAEYGPGESLVDVCREYADELVAGALKLPTRALLSADFVDLAPKLREYGYAPRASFLYGSAGRAVYGGSSAATPGAHLNDAETDDDDGSDDSGGSGESDDDDDDDGGDSDGDTGAPGAPRGAARGQRDAADHDSDGEFPCIVRVDSQTGVGHQLADIRRLLHFGGRPSSHYVYRVAGLRGASDDDDTDDDDDSNDVARVKIGQSARGAAPGTGYARRYVLGEDGSDLRDVSGVARCGEMYRSDDDDDDDDNNTEYEDEDDVAAAAGDYRTGGRALPAVQSLLDIGVGLAPNAGAPSPAAAAVSDRSRRMTGTVSLYSRAWGTVVPRPVSIRVPRPRLMWRRRFSMRLVRARACYDARWRLLRSDSARPSLLPGVAPVYLRARFWRSLETLLATRVSRPKDMTLRLGGSYSHGQPGAGIVLPLSGRELDAGAPRMRKPRADVRVFSPVYHQDGTSSGAYQPAVSPGDALHGQAGEYERAAGDEEGEEEEENEDREQEQEEEEEGGGEDGGAGARNTSGSGMVSPRRSDAAYDSSTARAARRSARLCGAIDRLLVAAASRDHALYLLSAPAVPYDIGQYRGGRATTRVQSRAVSRVWRLAGAAAESYREAVCTPELVEYAASAQFKLLADVANAALQRTAARPYAKRITEDTAGVLSAACAGATSFASRVLDAPTPADLLADLAHAEACASEFTEPMFDDNDWCAENDECMGVYGRYARALVQSYWAAGAAQRQSTPARHVYITLNGPSLALESVARRDPAAAADVQLDQAEGMRRLFVLYLLETLARVSRSTVIAQTPPGAPESVALGTVAGCVKFLRPEDDAEALARISAAFEKARFGLPREAQDMPIGLMSASSGVPGPAPSGQRRQTLHVYRRILPYVKC